MSCFACVLCCCRACGRLPAAPVRAAGQQAPLNTTLHISHSASHLSLCSLVFLLLSQSLRPGFRLHLYAQLGSKRGSTGGSSSTCPSGDSHVIKVGKENLLSAYRIDLHAVVLSM
jgi:hypothetical protein